MPGGCAFAQNGLIPPPAIHIPYGGRVATDINLSDSDVLGIIKQALPAVGDVLRGVAPAIAHSGHGQKEMQVVASLATQLDLKELTEAIAGIKNVRLLVVVYGSGIERDQMLSQLDAGVAKTGKFSRVLGDVGATPGVMALYAEPGNKGYLGFAYDPGSRVLYALRVVGFVDIPRLTKWIGSAAQAVIGAAMPPVAVPGTPEPEAAPGTAPEQPAEPAPAAQ